MAVTGGAIAGPLQSAPAGTPRTVRVATERELQSAVRRLASGTTILIAPGTYRLTGPLVVQGSLRDVAIRGEGPERNSVVLAGPGMNAPANRAVTFGIWTGGGVDGITIANLTIRDVSEHAIIFNAGTQRPLVSNVRLVDTGQQFLKSNPDASGSGVDNGVVEDSAFEYTTTAKSSYTNGVDVHAGKNWIVRRNMFRNITSASGLAGPAVLMWNRSRNSVVEGNTFINCARGIALGLDVKSGGDHAGGIVRNNFFYRAAGQRGDVGIIVSDSAGTRVVNNTVFVSGTYATPIEYRFPGTKDAVIANNLLDGAIGRRDGATGMERTNYTNAPASAFVDAMAGNLHVARTAVEVIDRGTSMADVMTDWDGDTRPQGAGYDIGADEWR